MGRVDKKDAFYFLLSNHLFFLQNNHISNEEYKRCRAVYDQLLKIEGATDTNIDPSATKLISFMSPDGVVSFTPETITSLLSYDALLVFNEVYRRYGIDHLAR